MANTTASASGTNRYFATPDRKNIGRKTMQMQSVETSAGVAICAAPCKMPSFNSAAFFQIAFDILNRHRGIVNQNSHRQRQSAQRHDVDGLPQQAQHNHRTQNRERNRNRDDDGAPPASQEQQNHQARQHSGNHRFPDHAHHRAAHKRCLIADRRNLQRRGQSQLHLRQNIQNAAHHRKSRSRARFQYCHQHTAIAILPDNIRLRDAAVADAGHVMHINNHSVGRLLYRQISQSRNCHWSGIQMNVIFDRCRFWRCRPAAPHSATPARSEPPSAQSPAPAAALDRD